MLTTGGKDLMGGKDDLVKKVLAQTDYSEEKALAKLEEFNYDLMRVLKDYTSVVLELLLRDMYLLVEHQTLQCVF